MIRYRLFFLMLVLAVTPAYKWRCWWMCTDQTAVQNDYIERRDHCREYADYKLDMAMHEAQESGEPVNRDSMLVTLYSHCMSMNDWSVPDGKEKAAAGAVGAAGVAGAAAAGAAVSPAAAAMAAAEDKSNMQRTAECAFARQEASVSSIAADRADACDQECKRGLEESPGAPRPAACPDPINDKYKRGSEN